MQGPDVEDCNNNIVKDSTADEDDDHEVYRKRSKRKYAAPEKWKDNIRKKQRNLGKAYISRCGKSVEERSLKPKCTSCKFKCSEQICDDERKMIFNQFWSTGSKQRQMDFTLLSFEL